MEHLFRQLMIEKKRFLLPVIFFLIVYYFSLPLSLAWFPEQMNATPPFTSITWGWLYSFSQFSMTWIFGWMYWRKAKRFDELIEEMKREVE